MRLIVFVEVVVAVVYFFLVVVVTDRMRWGVGWVPALFIWNILVVISVLKLRRGGSFGQIEECVPDGRTDGPTDQRTDGWTDARTDKPSYRDAWTHLKTFCIEICKWE